MSSEVFSVGVDIGGTHTQVGVVRGGKDVVARRAAKTQGSLPVGEVMDNIAAAIREAAEEAGVALADLAGIGVAAPGAVDADKGVVIQAGNLSWDNLPIGPEMSKRLDGVNVRIDNDVNAAVFGEATVGAGDGAQDAIGFWVGTGIGGGIVSNGQVFRGAAGTAGEVGHMVMLPGAPTGERILEHLASRSAVVGRVGKILKMNKPTMVTSLLKREGHDARDATKLNAWIIGEAYKAGDDLVTTVVNESAVTLGHAIGNLVSVLAIPLVLVGGGLAEACGSAYIDVAAEAAKSCVFPEAHADLIDVRETQLRENAGLLGAAAIARAAG